MTISEWLSGLFALPAAMILSAVMTWVIRPLLKRYALAEPNARSSHRIPTPQGAGIAVIVATLVVAAIMIYVNIGNSELPVAVFASAMLMALTGFADDFKSIEVLPRLLLQAVAVGFVILASSSELRIVAACPLWIERGILLMAGLWFVNLVNFMDGLDWMTIAEVVPITFAMLVLGSLHDLPASATIIAASLCGAMLGFAPFNRPVAKLFLGDVGSLPIGLLLGWCLLQLAYQQQLAAALLLPLYYLCDATTTLISRLIRREPFWKAHRSHFYQRATNNGFTVWRVVSEVFALNIVLAVLAITSAVTESSTARIVVFVIGSIAVGFVLVRFSRPQQLLSRTNNTGEN